MALTNAAGGFSAGGPLTYQSLKEKYADFGHPWAAVQLGGETLGTAQSDFVIGDIHVELTAGYEASAASFRIFDVYDSSTGQFGYEKVKRQVMLGNSVTKDVAEVIETYVYAIGLGEGSQFSYSTAISLMQTLIGFIMVWLTNKLSQKTTEYSLW